MQQVTKSMGQVVKGMDKVRTLTLTLTLTIP